MGFIFCSACGVTTIADYTLRYDKFGILRKGKCKKCGQDVARLVEDEEKRLCKLAMAYNKR